MKIEVQGGNGFKENGDFYFVSCDLGRYAETIYLSALEFAMFFVFVFVGVISFFTL